MMIASAAATSSAATGHAGSDGSGTTPTATGRRITRVYACVDLGTGGGEPSAGSAGCASGGFCHG